MEAQAVESSQLGLFRRAPNSVAQGRPAPVSTRRHERALPPRPITRLCAGCRAKEARYGFQPEEGIERPKTLCFECFRMEIDRRQRVAAQLARGWNAEQVNLPLADTLKELSRRRRRAQIAARHELAEGA